MTKVAETCRWSATICKQLADIRLTDGESGMINQRGIKAARRALGQQLAALRQAAGYNQHGFAERVRYSRSSQANVETGHQKGSREYWLRCDELLGTGGQLTAGYDEVEAEVRRQHEKAARSLGLAREQRLVQPHVDEPGHQDAWSIRERVARAAKESSRFLAHWESRSLSTETVEELAEDLGWLAQEYVYRPIDNLFDDLVAARDRASGLLREQRRTGDIRTLLVTAGVACGMLAHASIDLGDRRAAAEQARVATRLAMEAGHHGLVAWLLGTQSLTAYCLRRPERAVEYAARGQRYATSGTAVVRLAALKARALAAQGDSAAARHALTEAGAIAEKGTVAGDLDNMGGILTFPRAKQSYYAASTAALLADGRATENHAQVAIATYEAAPAGQRSYGDLALARVALAQAQLLKPGRALDPAAADAALAPVLGLPEQHRIAGLHRPLRKVQVHLERGPVRDSADAAHLSAKIDTFLDETRAIKPT